MKIAELCSKCPTSPSGINQHRANSISFAIMDALFLASAYHDVWKPMHGCVDMTMAKTFEILNRMVADGIIQTYVVAGAVAALNYIEPAATRDVDVMITFTAQTDGGLVTLGGIVPYLNGLGYTEWEEEGLLVEGWPVQFLPAADDLDREALEHAVEIEDSFGGDHLIRIRLLSAHHIVATALRTGRYKDFGRIEAFLEEEAVDLGDLQAVLERHELSEKWAEFCMKTGRSNPFAVKKNGEEPSGLQS